MGSSSLAVPPGWEVEKPTTKPTALAVPHGWEVEHQPQQAAIPTPAPNPARGKWAQEYEELDKSIGSPASSGNYTDSSGVKYVGHRRADAWKPTPGQFEKTEEALHQFQTQFPGTSTGGMPSAREAVEGPGLLLGGELLPSAAAAVNNPVVKTALRGAGAAANVYFTTQMAKGAGRTFGEAFDAYKQGDYVKMAAKLGHAGTESLLAALGIRGLAKTGVVPIGPEIPARDLGPKPEPEVLPGKDIGSGAPEAKAEGPKVTWRKGEETYAEYQKRKGAAKGATASTPTVKPKATATPARETPEQEIARLDEKENEKLKGPVVAKPKEAVAAAPSTPAPSPKTVAIKPPDAKPPVAETKPTPAETPAPVAETKPPEAETKPKHDYSTTHVTLPEEVATKVKSLAEKIPQESLTADGREADPHITVKYGLHGDDADQVREVLKDHPPIKVKLGETSLFSNPEADVVKIDVDSPDLHALNKKIADALPHTDTHPEYKPHVTVAYVKPGEGAKFSGDKSLAGHEVEMNSVTFSDRNGNKVDIPLGGKSVEPTKEEPKVEEVEEVEEVAVTNTTPVAETSTSVAAVKPPIKPDEPKLNLRQKLKAAQGAEEPARTGLPGPAVERSAPIEPARATANNPSIEAPKARQEVIELVQDIANTATGNRVEKVKITPVDAAQKPVGEPIEMDLTKDSKDEVRRISSELSAHKGGIFIDLGDALGENKLKNWFKAIPEARTKQEAPIEPIRENRSSEKLAPEIGADLVSNRAIQGIKRGSTFMYMGAIPGERGGHTLVAPNGDAVMVSDQDFQNGFVEKGDLPLSPSGEYREIGEAEAPRGPGYVKNHFHSIPKGSVGDERVAVYVVSPEALSTVMPMTQNSEGVGGVFVGPEQLERMISRVHDKVFKLPGQDDFLTSIQRAAGQGKSAILIRDNVDFKSTLRHELDHHLQELVRDSLPYPAYSAMQKFANGTLAKKATAYLASRYPSTYKPNPHSMTAADEIGVRLMQPGHHEDMGLTIEEARELAADYIRTLRNQYGKATPREIASRAFDALRRTDRSSARQLTQVSGGVRQGGGSSLKGRTGEGPPIASNPGEELTPARDGSLRYSPKESNPERGSASLDFVTGGLARLTERDPGTVEKPRRNFSTYGAIKSKYNRNLAQTEKAAPEVFEETIRAGSAKSQWSTVMHSAMPAINKALRENGGPSPEKWREAMTQDSLIGKQERWINYARGVDTATNDELTKSLQNYGFGALDRLNGKLQSFPPGQDLTDSAASLLADKDFDTLRTFLRAVYSEAAESVNEVMPPEEFEEITENPGFQKALEVYKQRVNPFMAEVHGRNEGVMSDAYGPSGVYYPLVPVEPPVRAAGAGTGPTLAQPKNPSNYFATGISESGYDTSLEAFNKKGVRDTWLNNKAVAVQSMKDSGLLAPHAPGDPRETFEWNGEIYKADTISNAVPRIIVKDGKVTHVGAGQLIGPHWFIKEIRPVFEKPNFDEDDVNRIVKMVNILSIKGIQEPIYHSSNIVGSLVCNTPFLGPSMMDAAISNPFTKMYGAIFKVLSQNPTTEEFSRSLIEASKVGGVPSRFGDTTFSRQYAEDTGARLDRPHWPPIPSREGRATPAVFGEQHGTPGESKLSALTGFSLSPILYGPHGIDARARVLLFDLSKSLDPQASPGKMFNIMNQLGNYTFAFQSQIERSMKASGLSWFYTAGSTAIRSGVKANIPGATELPTEHMDAADKVKTHAQQYLTGSGMALVALWLGSYRAYRGKFPWDPDEPPSQLLRIPLKDEHRYSEAGKAMYGDDSTTGFIDFSYFNPLPAGRGFSALGARGAYNTAMLGGTPQQDFEAAFRDSLNTFLHPVEGPAFREFFVLGTTLLGQPKEPYITMGPGLFPLGPKNMTPGQKVMANLKQINPFYGGLGSNMGFGFQDQKDKGNRWLRMATDLTFQRLIPPAVNLEGQRKYLQKDATEEDKEQ